MELLIQKKCGRCGEIQPRSEFNRDRYTKSGLRSQCKTCMQKEREESVDRRREWRTTPERKKWYREYRAGAYTKNKFRSDARNAARKLAREPCEICGDVVAQAHHDDYNKPLEVRWLCVKHHREWHRHNKPKYPEVA